ncbi:efflux RND transporter periplasmic adaptor subunit [Kushneria aurantia]|uniref:Efflux RND transporter periplasmic adaptor subunit n=1 Tax=Kushneria aurantia TaxID=504092 RepID=A0ABV6G4Q8_9GAMM|nr:efflux RND transporter periplasmic adaptor subunit [Kushneria aurantia]
MPDSQSGRRSSAGRVLLALALLLTAGAAVWWFVLRDSPAAPAGPAAPPGSSARAVSAITVERGSFPVTVTALGTLRSLGSVEIRPQIQGRLTAINFEEGQRVSAGDVLARLDDNTQQAQLAQANAQLTQSQAQLTNARSDLQRYEDLVRASNISRQQLENQRQLVSQYQGAVEAARAGVEEARARLAYTVLRAPTDGIIGLRNVDPGNIVSSGDDAPITTLDALDPISVVFALPQRHIRELRRLMPDSPPTVRVISGDGDEMLASGRLSALDSALDTDTGTLSMRARLPNAAGALYPNTFVNVEVVLRTLDNVVLAPLPAIVHGDEGNHVYVVNDDGIVSRRSVELGPRDDRRAVVDSGLESGERVVVDGVDRLRDGTEVRVVRSALPGEAEQRVANDGAS